MSRLLLIRHGQASFGAADYDVLSELGLEQSRRLGAHLAATGIAVDALYVGPRRRHAGTLDGLRAAAAEAGVEMPEAEVLAGLDEYPIFDLLAHWGPLLRRDHPDLAGRLAAGSARAMEQIIAMWARGELETGELETFLEFDARVTAAIDHIRRQQGRGRTALVVTSGGPVSVAVRCCLDITPEKTLGLAWSLVNSSITEMRYRGDAIGLVALNRVPHLPHPELQTRR